MPAPEWLNTLFGRLTAYPLWQVAVELAVIAAIVYMILRFVRGTRAAGALGALLLLLLVTTVLVRIASQRDLFPRLAQIYERFLGFSAIALLIIFQPELRRGLMRLGELPAVRPVLRLSGGGATEAVVDALVSAGSFLSKNKFGAIVAIERQQSLRDLLEGCTLLNADASAELLESIFWPNNPLHDMGVVIKGRKIMAAGVQFPLAEADDVRDASLGTRHRAAVGLTRASDAVVVVISEETGAISVCERGALKRWLTPEGLRVELLRALRTGPSGAAPNAFSDTVEHGGDGSTQLVEAAGESAVAMAPPDQSDEADLKRTA